MSENVKLKVDAEPTIFNKEMVIGTMITPVIGTIIGGYIGKNRMEEEKKHGRTVSKDASFWNEDTLLGGLIGSFVGSLAGSIVFSAVAAGVALSTAVSTPGLVAGGTLALGLGTAAAVELGVIALGAYIGGKMGVSRQQGDYDAAVKQTVVDHISKCVSPEVALTVEQSIAKEKDWAKSVAAQKMLIDAQAAR